jgi:TonB family protein
MSPNFSLALELWPATAAQLLNHLWQSSVVALVLLAVVTIARKLPARTRQTICWLALAKFAVPIAPLAELITPPSILHQATVETVKSALPQIVFVVTPTEPDATASQSSMRSPAGVLFSLWASGTALCIGVWTARVVQTRRSLLRETEPASSALQTRLAAAAERVSLRRTPSCLVTHHDSDPGILGIFRPTVLLPRGLELALTRAELESVLLHEVVHLRRRDNLWALLQAVVVSMLWFNPIAWLISRSISIATEMACDERVVEITRDAETYATMVVKCARYSLGVNQPAFAGIGSPPVMKRLRNVLAGERQRSIWVRGAALLAAVAAIGFSGYAGTIAAIAVPSGEPVSAPTTANESGSAPMAASMTPPAAEVASPTESGDPAPTPSTQPVPVSATVSTLPLGEGRYLTLARSTDDKAETRIVAAQTITPPPAIGSTSGVAPTLADVSLALVPPRRFGGTVQIARNSQANTAEAQLPAATDAAVAATAVVPTATAPSEPKATAVSPSPMEPAKAVRATLGNEPIYELAELDHKPQVRSQATPQYPLAMKQAHVAGSVTVDFVVTSEGKVAEAKATRSTRPEFEEAAVAGVSKWLFKPGRKEGRNIATHMQVPIEFQPTPEDAERARQSDTTARQAPASATSAAGMMRGTALVSFVVEKNGEIKHLKGIGVSRPDLKATAIEVVNTWSKNPTMVAGLPVGDAIAAPLAFTGPPTPANGRSYSLAEVDYTRAPIATSKHPRLPPGLTATFTISEAGTIERVQVTGTDDPKQIERVTKTLTEAKYTPGIRNGRPVAFEQTITSTTGGSTRDASKPRTQEQAVSPKSIYTVAEVDEKPVAQKTTRAEFPRNMWRQEIEGIVVVDLVVTADGNVANPAVVSSTNHEFEKNALVAVNQWKYRPGRKAGQPVATHLQVPVRFTIDPIAPPANVNFPEQRPPEGND